MRANLDPSVSTALARRTNFLRPLYYSATGVTMMGRCLRGGGDLSIIRLVHLVQSSCTSILCFTVKHVRVGLGLRSQKDEAFRCILHPRIRELRGTYSSSHLARDTYELYVGAVSTITMYRVKWILIRHVSYNVPDLTICPTARREDLL